MVVWSVSGTNKIRVTKVSYNPTPWILLKRWLSNESGTSSAEMRYRTLVPAGLLGASIVMLGQLLAVERGEMDKSLTYAVVAFAVAIPLLVFSVVNSGQRQAHRYPYDINPV